MATNRKQPKPTPKHDPAALAPMVLKIQEARRATQPQFNALLQAIVDHAGEDEEIARALMVATVGDSLLMLYRDTLRRAPTARPQDIMLNLLESIGKTVMQRHDELLRFEAERAKGQTKQ